MPPIELPSFGCWTADARCGLVRSLDPVNPKEQGELGRLQCGRKAWRVSKAKGQTAAFGLGEPKGEIEARSDD